MKNKGFAPIVILIVFFASILILIFVVAPFYGFRLFDRTSATIDPGFSNRQPEPVACTMEAKLCPDGSYVSRSGPKCEFAACPTTKIPTTSTPTPVSQQRRF